MGPIPYCSEGNGPSSHSDSYLGAVVAVINSAAFLRQYVGSLGTQRSEGSITAAPASLLTVLYSTVPDLC